ncbi:MAG: ketoacyl-ACP synthase III [Verrucomicrobiales bacterium]|jgi:3-oxoacyl-[acyl-carrier-protein] synthase-3|nr:ketoacyl-ACP synthase III [Verrucomicrobiales bacterium]
MKILATGKYLPEKVTTNAFFEKLLDTTDEWIFTRSGIRERRTASEQETCAHMATQSALDAMDKTDVNPADIGMVIVATTTPDTVFPSVACQVQAAIGAKNAGAFDLQAACSGFLYSLILAHQFLKSDTCQYILVIGAEKLSAITNLEDRTTAVLFGDGAGAVLVQANNDPHVHGRLLAFDLGADGEQEKILFMHNANTARANAIDITGGAYINMSGQEVFKHAVTEMAKSAQKTLAAAGLTMDDIRCVIPHQANMRIVKVLADRLKVPKEKCFTNLERYGNISAACIPVALSEAEKHYNLQPGDKILMVAFGGGLTWASAVMEW